MQQKKHIKYLKHTISIAITSCMLLFTEYAMAQPANDVLYDGICHATFVPVNGTCVNGQTNFQATSDYYGGCIQSGHPSVWYTFTITAPNDWAHIELNDLAPAQRETEVMLFNGTCASPSGIAAFCETAPITNIVSFDFYSLAAGTYYLYISTQPGVGNILTNFDICVTQGVTPPLITGPEQDCEGAIAVCDMSYTQGVSYDGYWDTQELPLYFTCLRGGETNSVWYTFTPQSAGDLAFTITTLKDYDWALYNLTAIGGCSAIPSSLPVRCNYSDDPGNTGMGPLGTLTTCTATQSAWCSVLPITAADIAAGTTFALIIDNYSADINGYTLDFSASTTSIADNPPATGAYPFMVSASTSCTTNVINVTMSEGVKCLTINQGNYTLTNTTTSTNFTGAITSLTGVNCSTAELTTQLQFTHNGTLTTGVYQISVNAGAVLEDKCGNLIQPGGTVSFNYLAPLSLTASPTSICSGQTATLDANGADGTPSVTTYTLSPGGLTNNTNGIFSGLAPVITTNYNVSATFGGCTRTATATIGAEGNIITSISPGTSTVCSFPVTLTASTMINGVACPTCTYLWSAGATPINATQATVAAAGTFTVTVTSPSGCHNNNSPSSTLSLATSGAGASSCDVIYVSPAGGGTGLIKTSPTTLANAISMAQCTYAIIKMQKGIYNLTDFQIVHSFATIEGGYDALFTIKSSDLTGGTNSTTIRRSNTADSDDEFSCTAFRVEGSATSFRIQDIRIELPGSASGIPVHTAGSGIINYGIVLGTGSNSYNIVRCYIDAGIGTAP